MAKTFQCSLVTPERLVIDTQVTYADVPAHDGQMGFLADHAPILFELGKGKLSLRLADNSVQDFNLDGGFAQMNANRLTLLSEKAATKA